MKYAPTFIALLLSASSLTAQTAGTPSSQVVLTEEILQYVTDPSDADRVYLLTESGLQLVGLSNPTPTLDAAYLTPASPASAAFAYSVRDIATGSGDQLYALVAKNYVLDGISPDSLALYSVSAGDFSFITELSSDSAVEGYLQVDGVEVYVAQTPFKDNGTDEAEDYAFITYNLTDQSLKRKDENLSFSPLFRDTRFDFQAAVGGPVLSLRTGDYAQIVDGGDSVKLAFDYGGTGRLVESQGRLFSTNSFMNSDTTVYITEDSETVEVPAGVGPLSEIASTDDGLIVSFSSDALQVRLDSIVVWQFGDTISQKYPWYGPNVQDIRELRREPDGSLSMHYVSAQRHDDLYSPYGVQLGYFASTRASFIIRANSVQEMFAPGDVAGLSIRSDSHTATFTSTTSSGDSVYTHDVDYTLTPPSGANSFGAVAFLYQRELYISAATTYNQETSQSGTINLGQLSGDLGVLPLHVDGFPVASFETITVSTDATVLALRPLPATALNLSPNPTTGLLTARLTGYSVGEFEWCVRDAQGRLVNTLAVPGGAATTVELDLSPLPAGMYFVELRSATEVGVYRILRQ